MINVKDEIDKRIPLLKSTTNNDIKYLINEEILKASEKTFIEDKKKEKIKNDLFNEIIGLGKIEPYLKDKSINEIMINGPENIFVEKNGEIVKTDLKLSSVELDNIIQKIVSKVNKNISFAKPIVDARLKDGSRVNIVNYPIALNGPIVTIRKFSKELLDIDDLINNGTLNNEVAMFLKYIVGKRYNIFISGGTGSGKTTLLNIISNFIDKNERIITIEDSAELKLKHIDNLISLEARDGNYENTSKITIRDLIVTSLRMRPDRIIVGEVRGNETFDMLQAMNTGHDGSLSTGHANSSKDMLTRLESMVIMSFDIPLDAIKRQIASAIEILIHISRDKNGKRKIVEINQILGYQNSGYVFNKLFEYNNVKKTLEKVNDLKEIK